MSFGSDPGRDDSSLPPVNMVIPDDARELERDVIAYRRERRARKRRERLMRLLGPLHGHGAILPLIATCVALSMLAGAMLSVVTISPASAPTVPTTPGKTPAASAPVTLLPAITPTPSVTALPAGTVRVGARKEPVRRLVSSVLAIVPANCSCAAKLNRLATEAKAARTPVYFVGENETAINQLADLSSRDGDGTAVPVADTSAVLDAAFHPSGLTALLVYSNAEARALRNLPASFNLGPALPSLARAAK